jgi:hypothetical protein
MYQNGTVVLTNATTGRFSLRIGDAGYVLAEQLDAQPMLVGGHLSGSMQALGIETLTDPSTGTEYSVNILAYDLSLEAVEQEFR